MIQIQITEEEKALIATALNVYRGRVGHCGERSSQSVS